jgi:hypothetical protein
MGIEAETEIGLPLPVLEVVNRFPALAGEVGDLVLDKAVGSQKVDGFGVHVDDSFVGRDLGCVIFESAGRDFPAQA